MTRSNVSFSFFRLSRNTFSLSGDGCRTLYSKIRSKCIRNGQTYIGCRVLTHLVDFLHLFEYLGGILVLQDSCPDHLALPLVLFELLFASLLAWKTVCIIGSSFYWKPKTEILTRLIRGIHVFPTLGGVDGAAPHSAGFILLVLFRKMYSRSTREGKYLIFSVLFNTISMLSVGKCESII